MPCYENMAIYIQTNVLLYFLAIVNFNIRNIPGCLSSIRCFLYLLYGEVSVNRGKWNPV